MDRVKLTCLHTASGTETSVVTALGAAARNWVCDLVTAVNTIIVVGSRLPYRRYLLHFTNATFFSGTSPQRP